MIVEATLKRIEQLLSVVPCINNNQPFVERPALWSVVWFQHFSNELDSHWIFYCNCELQLTVYYLMAPWDFFQFVYCWIHLISFWINTKFRLCCGLEYIYLRFFLFT